MVIGSLFSFLSPTKSALRDEEDNPRSLFARADLRAVNRQRRQLLNNFGFEDTISEPNNPRSGNAINAAAERKTLLGGRKNVK